MNRGWKKIRQYLEELKRGNKKFPKDGMLILFFGGILLYVITLPTNNNTSYYKKTQDLAGTASQEVENTQYHKELEKELEEFLTHVEGVGEVEVLIYTNSEEQLSFAASQSQPQIEGIVIAAQGASEDEIRVRLMRMAMALYGVEANKVEVLTLQENEKRTGYSVLSGTQAE